MDFANYWFSSGAGGGGGGYQIANSLRFRGAQWLNRTPALSPTDPYKWTFSLWVKKAINEVGASLLDARYSSTNYEEIWFSQNATIDAIRHRRVVDSAVMDNRSLAVYRDPSAWYHVVIVYDCNNADSAERSRFYINGVRSEHDNHNPVGLNQISNINRTVAQRLGRSNVGGYLDGYLAEVHMLDGVVVNNADDFGEFNDDGVWVPKAVTGLTYGTNGFYLDFSDPSNIGADRSGNGNNWTATNFTTSGTGTDVMEDTPTTNWVTLNPLDKGSSITLSSGNLDYSQYNTSPYEAVKSTFAMGSGKWYWEVYISNRSDTFHSRPNIGILTAEDVIDDYIGSSATGYSYFVDANNAANAIKVNNNSFDPLGTGGYGTGDTVMFAFDNVNGNLWFGKNGTWLLSGDPATSSNPIYSSIPYKQYLAAISSSSSNFATTACTLNAGQGNFEYTPPTGFNALNTANLPAPDIANGSEYFNTVTYTGDGTSSHAITGVGFQPDWVWLKSRSLAQAGNLIDVVRGVDKYLRSSSTAAEGTFDFLSSFDTDGFTLGTSDAGVNQSSATYVAWNWLAANGTSNIPAGSIDGTNPTIASTVSANTTAGFSIVTYTGNATAGATIAHGLGVKPKWMIVRQRDNASHWAVYTETEGAGRHLLLSSTQAATNSGANNYFTAEPTSTVFTVGSNGNVNANNGDILAYCFAEVEGYSKFGSYTGNGSSDGPFVYCGFKPALIILKSSSAVDNWRMYDNKRLGYNPDAAVLYPNLTTQESVSDHVDFLSSGFKLRSTSNNTSGVTYVFMALAEHPFGGSGVSPATAR